MIFSGDWRDSDRAAAQEGADLLSTVITLDDVVFESRASVPGNYYAYVTPGITDRILFKAGMVTKELVVHELGHIINDRAPRGHKPADLLARYGVKTSSGKLVTGPGLGGYRRYAGRHAPANGYKNDTYPHHQHTRSMKDWNKPVEDWPDMLLSLVTNNFADNEAGTALHGWVTDYLKARLSQCVD